MNKNNDVIKPSKPPTKKTKKSKSYSVKTSQIDHLNSLLHEYATKKGLSSYVAACKQLKIPTNSAKVTTKQISGYIGMVKAALRK